MRRAQTIPKTGSVRLPPKVNGLKKNVYGYDGAHAGESVASARVLAANSFSETLAFHATLFEHTQIHVRRICCCCCLALLYIAKVDANARKRELKR
jgi:hypothetical protein